MSPAAAGALPGAPGAAIAEARVKAVALTGADFPRLRPVFAVQKGQAVQVGQVLFTDRRHPEVAVVSPLAGRVTALELTSRRMLAAVVVEADADEGSAGEQRAGKDGAAAAGEPEGATRPEGHPQGATHSDGRPGAATRADGQAGAATGAGAQAGTAAGAGGQAGEGPAGAGAAAAAPASGSPAAATLSGAATPPAAAPASAPPAARAEGAGAPAAAPEAAAPAATSAGATTRSAHLSEGESPPIASPGAATPPAAAAAAAEPGVAPDAPADPAALRALLLARGLWPAFVARPFGGMPAPDAVPQAILVTAVPADPLGPDPRLALAGRGGDLARGLAALAALTPGLVHLCQPPGADLAPDAPPRVRAHSFGDRRERLAGAHLRRLHSVAAAGQVWTIEVQDVAAIGHLLATGRYDARRVVALSGPRAAEPRLLRLPLGASLAEATAGEVAPAAVRPGRLGGPVRDILPDAARRTAPGAPSEAAAAPALVLSGPRRTGRPAAWLGLRDRQVSVMEAGDAVSAPPSAAHPLLRALDRLLAPRGGSPLPRPVWPTRALEHALPPGFHPVPLARALAVGDAEAAARLGARDLLEEDMADLTARCTSGTDYAAALRRVLDELEQA